MINRAKEEKLITKYLLGQATEEECVRIEEGYFHRPEYYEQVLAIEEELISNYVRGTLSSSERSLFETHFLSSERRRKKYELTKDLVTYLSESYLPARHTLDARKSWRSRFFGNIGGITAWRLAGPMMAVMLISIIGLVWVSKDISDPLTDSAVLQVKAPTGDQIDDLKPTPSPAIALQTQPPDQQPRLDLTEDSQPGDSVQIARADISRRETTSIPEFVIDLSGLRTPDEIPEVKVPSRMATIQLNLSLSELDYTSYEIEIKTVEGKLVLRRNNLRLRQSRDGRILAVRIPSKILKETDFVLDISGVKESGETKMLHESFFTVKRQ